MYPYETQSVWLGRMTKLGLEWSKGPDLLLTRFGHRSIGVGNQIYHIGGQGKFQRPVRGVFRYLICQFLNILDPSIIFNFSGK